MVVEIVMSGKDTGDDRKEDILQSGNSQCCSEIQQVWNRRY